MKRFLHLIAVAIIVLASATSIEAKPKGERLKLHRPLKVVCLGNSITHHGYLPAVEWYSEWGMAASKPENDYCHLLQSSLQRYNRKSSVTPLNIAYFEQNPHCDIDSLIGNSCAEADVIVIRIGENVTDVEAFGQNIDRLIEYCTNLTPHVVISGCFWQHDAKESILVKAAERYALEFVPLSWIAFQQDIYPKKGDILYDVEGKEYPITKEFIITHPNDKGMRAIATAIQRAIELLAR